MKRLIAQVLCHPFVALAALHMTDLMLRSDSGVAGALFVLTARSVSKLVDALRRTSMI
ncbi:hypothetical protein AWB77_01285 [Caballeronia fortuita]|uniref:Uncharacterized protein n=1 Tax=Caballeronia fortuita TaxID=1777138 RepID=A0A158A010_9BURK|nr:hypothetical protein [Caballeronia fortuita]SAK51026.1 hypothetical protein AWB77_01285 [Caballeronia fortuita]